MSTEIELLVEKVKKKSTLMKWGIGLAAVMILSPITWLLAYGVLGTAALGASLAIAGVVGLAVINLTPGVVMKFENARINAIIAEANKNPIPTLWAGHSKDAEELKEMSKAIEDYATEIANVNAKANKLTSDLTPEDLNSFRLDIQALELDLSLQEEDYAQALQMHAAQEVQIKRASAIWDLNMAVSKANAKNLNRAEETMAKIKRETALDSVQSSLNRSKAQLRARIRDRHSTQTIAVSRQPHEVLLPPSNDQVIDLIPTSVKVKV